MGGYISLVGAKQRHGAVDIAALSEKLSPEQRRLLRLGVVRFDIWKQLPPQAIYQIAISEVLEDGSVHGLATAGARAFTVTAVLDLGLRMLESPRGRQALENLAGRTFRDCRCRNKAVAGTTPHDCPETEALKAHLPTAIHQFLLSVRRRFPTVTLDKRVGFRETNSALDRRHMDDFSREEPPILENADLRFNPKESTVLHLSWELTDKLYWTRLKADDPWLAYDDPRITRFRRLQFHLSTMVAHHLCHLFIASLHADPLLSLHVNDMRISRLVDGYDAGAEFELQFFGGRPRLFIDYVRPGKGKGKVGEDRGVRGLEGGDVGGRGTGKRVEGRYAGRSYLVKRGEDGRRVAAVLDMQGVADYLRGDFSDSLTVHEGEDGAPTWELYRDIKRRNEPGSTELYRERALRRAEQERNSTAIQKNQDPTKAKTFIMPWDVTDHDYHLLKKSCYDPSIRLGDLKGFL